MAVPRSEAEKVALAQHGAGCFALIWEVRLEEDTNTALQRLVDRGVGRLRVCVREHQKCGQKGAILVTFST